MKNCCVVEHYQFTSILTKICGKDKATLRSLWLKDREFSGKRLSKVIPFKNKNILEFSQGDKELRFKKWI